MQRSKVSIRNLRNIFYKNKRFLLQTLLFFHCSSNSKIEGRLYSRPSSNFSQFILQWEWVFGLHPDHWNRFKVSVPTTLVSYFCNFIIHYSKSSVKRIFQYIIVITVIIFNKNLKSSSNNCL